MSKSRNLSLCELKEFKSEYFYQTFEDTSYFLEKSRQVRARPTLEGAKLIAEYYKAKYGCEISFWMSEDYLDYVDALEELDSQHIIPLMGALEIEAGERKEFRKAILINFGKIHTIPLIYIKKGKDSVFLYANSLMVGNREIQILASIFRKLGTPLYYIPDNRQADSSSCHNEGLFFAREVTAFSKNDKDFKIPNLMQFLKENSLLTKFKGVSVVKKLPGNLLKASQISAFVDKFEDKVASSTVVIHKKGETLTLFRNRFTFKGAEIKQDLRGRTIKNVSSYIIQRGLKNRNIIKLQFYINQMQAILGKVWTLSMQEKFIVQAKALIKAKAKLSDEAQTRELHEFAKAYAIQCKKESDSVFSKIVLWFTEEKPPAKLLQAKPKEQELPQDEPPHEGVEGSLSIAAVGQLRRFSFI